MINKKQIEALIAERIAELDNGLFVVELNISATNVITVELDKHEGSVSVSDCMSVSRNVEHNLNREEQDFEITVSSAGLDKPFRVLAQYQKNLGRDVKVKLEDGTKLEGKLIEVDATKIVVENSHKAQVEGKKKKEVVVEQHTLPLNSIKETKIIISFK